MNVKLDFRKRQRLIERYAWDSDLLQAEEQWLASLRTLVLDDHSERIGTLQLVHPPTSWIESLTWHSTLPELGSFAVGWPDTVDSRTVVLHLGDFSPQLSSLLVYNVEFDYYRFSLERITTLHAGFVSYYGFIQALKKCKNLRCLRLIEPLLEDDEMLDSIHHSFTLEHLEHLEWSFPPIASQPPNSIKFLHLVQLPAIKSAVFPNIFSHASAYKQLPRFFSRLPPSFRSLTLGMHICGHDGITHGLLTYLPHIPRTITHLRLEYSCLQVLQSIFPKLPRIDEDTSIPSDMIPLPLLSHLELINHKRRHDCGLPHRHQFLYCRCDLGDFAKIAILKQRLGLSKGFQMDMERFKGQLEMSPYLQRKFAKLKELGFPVHIDYKN